MPKMQAQAPPSPSQPGAAQPGAAQPGAAQPQARAASKPPSLPRSLPLLRPLRRSSCRFESLRQASPSGSCVANQSPISSRPERKPPNKPPVYPTSPGAPRSGNNLHSPLESCGGPHNRDRVILRPRAGRVTNDVQPPCKCYRRAAFEFDIHPGQTSLPRKKSKLHLTLPTP